jgi:hypothetical protein
LAISVDDHAAVRKQVLNAFTARVRNRPKLEVLNPVITPVSVSMVNLFVG